MWLLVPNHKKSIVCISQKKKDLIHYSEIPSEERESFIKRKAFAYEGEGIISTLFNHYHVFAAKQRHLFRPQGFFFDLGCGIGEHSSFLSNEEANKYIELLDDSESKYKNHEKFVGMRGCQSIFSIICKQNKVYSISASECEWAEFEGGRRWDHLKNYPLLAKRDKKYNILKRFFNRQKKSLKRFLKKFQ